MSAGPDVWITGAGAITAAGRGLAPLWDAVLAGDVRTRTVGGAEGPRTCVGVVDGDPDADLPPKLRFALERSGRLMAAAVLDALASAGFTEELRRERPERWGLFSGSSIGPTAASLEAHARWMETGRARAGDVIRCAHGVSTSLLAGHLGFLGPVGHFGGGSVASSSAIGQGWMRVATGQLDACAVVGFEAPTSPAVLALFDSVGLLAHGGPESFRPFDVGRRGIHLGEAAAALVLESAAHARRRGARPLGRLRGYGESGEGTLHVAGPGSDGAALRRAVTLALDAAALAPSKVDVLHLHGTATAQHDPAEYRALASVFGPAELARTMATATKPITGHPLGACGAVEACIALQGLVHRQVPGVANLETVAADAPVPVCRETRSGDLDVALVTTAGFGGRDAAFVLETARRLFV